MWKVLGKEADIVRFGSIWKEEIMANAEGLDDFQDFKELMDQAEITYLHNTQADVHAFILQFPETVGKTELDYFASVIRAVRESIGCPTISFEDIPQRCRFVFTSEEEPELLGLNKTEGMSSGALFQPIFDSWSQNRNAF